MINDKQFRDLAAVENETCVSIYIPTNRVTSIKEDSIHLKNALKEAQQQLQDKGMEKEEAHTFLKEARALLDEKNEDFWREQSDGLAVFISENRFEYHEVPASFDDFTHVGDSFYILPLLNIVGQTGRFFVLALSQNEVRFYEGRPHAIFPVIIEDLVPANMEIALALDEPESHLQHHSAQSSGSGNSVYHGQGGGEDNQKELIKQYLKRVDSGLYEMLHDERAPMVIAAVDYEASMYKNLSQYSNVIDEVISGNPENLSATDLHTAAWKVLTPYFDKHLQEQKDNFSGFAAENKASEDLQDIVVSAANQRIERLYIAKHTHEWGTFDATKRIAEQHAERQVDSIGLLDAAARNTYLNGGKVFLLEQDEMPCKDAVACATYRYPMA